MGSPHRIELTGTMPDLGVHVREAMDRQSAMLSTMTSPPWSPPPALSDADVKRIAVAVVDEQERRELSPLLVTAEDVRRWCR